MTDEELTGLIQRYARPHQQDEQKARQERELLLQLGATAVPPLIRALDESRKNGAQLQAMRLAVLLAEVGDPRAVGALVEHFRWDSGFETNQTGQPLRVLISQLAQRRDASSIAALVELLRQLRFVHSELAILVATTLVELAKKKPVQELAAALPWLHSGFREPRAPLAFDFLRRQLKAFLSLTNLPLAAAAPQTTENLPRPASAEKETHE